MRREHWFRPVLVTLLLGAMIAGCGDAEGNKDAEGSKESSVQPSRAFGELVRGLRDAALADRASDAIRRSSDLDPIEAGVVVSFCETVRDLEDNSEIDLLKDSIYILYRIRNHAQFNLEIPFSEKSSSLRIKRLMAATRELARVVHLRSFDGKLNHRYKKTCGPVAAPPSS